MILLSTIDNSFARAFARGAANYQKLARTGASPLISFWRPIFQLTGLTLIGGFAKKKIQFAGGGVGIHLRIPILRFFAREPRSDLRPFGRLQAINRIFNF